MQQTGRNQCQIKEAVAGQRQEQQQQQIELCPAGAWLRGACDVCVGSVESRARGNNIFHASRARFEDSASRTAAAEAAAAEAAAEAALDDSVNLSKSF